MHCWVGKDVNRSHRTINLQTHAHTISLPTFSFLSFFLSSFFFVFLQRQHCHVLFRSFSLMHVPCLTRILAQTRH